MSDPQGARHNNLKDVTAAFPRRDRPSPVRSKSTLVNQILLKAAKRELLGSRVKPGEHDGSPV